MLSSASSFIGGFFSKTSGGTPKLFESTSTMAAFSLYSFIGTYMLWKASHMAGALTGSLAVAFSMGHHGADTTHRGPEKPDTAVSSGGGTTTEGAKGTKTTKQRNTRDEQ